MAHLLDPAVDQAHRGPKGTKKVSDGHEYLPLPSLHPVGILVGLLVVGEEPFRWSAVIRVVS